MNTYASGEKPEVGDKVKHKYDNYIEPVEAISPSKNYIEVSSYGCCDQENFVLVERSGNKTKFHPSYKEGEG